MAKGYIHSITAIQKHNDNLYFRKERSIIAPSLILLAIGKYIEPKYFKFDVIGKCYTRALHGQPSSEAYSWINAQHPINGLDQLKQQVSQQPKSPNIFSALSGIARLHTDRSKLFLIPTLDLEAASGNPNSFTNLVQTLIAAQLNGFIIRSGFSYHYIANFYMDYGPLYWKFMGYALAHLLHKKDTSDEALKNQKLAHEVGHCLMLSETTAEVEVLSKQILSQFPSISDNTTRPGVMVDPRWVGHRLQPVTIENELLLVNTLRIDNRKTNQETVPYFVGLIS